MGAAWFIKHVVPHIGIRTIIVGTGLEVLRHDGEPNAKIEVIGEVQNHAEWYLDAHLVVAPIFDGSGMKTKVVEALMFGKKVVGTQAHAPSCAMFSRIARSRYGTKTGAGGV
ncbi:glycosyltransferase family 4 protein [Methylocystis sp. H62]|uniref:glycosyltransferase family 4 protein n=1 Tax=Methylocystis sp. H62 TaxID=2785789 RepID=UPI0018C22E14|nr:glycosyltransferase family 4 protein [Methylocystis sp. H62]